MADTIHVLDHSQDPQTGGSSITLEVSYASSKKATILLKPAQSLASLRRDLEEELALLAETLTTASITGVPE
jgi:hypothetical protein